MTRFSNLFETYYRCRKLRIWTEVEEKPCTHLVIKKDDKAVMAVMATKNDDYKEEIKSTHKVKKVVLTPKDFADLGETIDSILAVAAPSWMNKDKEDPKAAKKPKKKFRDEDED